MTAPAVHFARLDVGAAEEARLAALLDTDERARAARFRNARDRRRFVVRRARTREWLAEAVGGDPARLRFDANDHGKPRLADGPPFSPSHSGETMMLAIGDTDLGCDVEAIDPTLDWPPLARTFFAPAETVALAALAPEAACAAFFACWSRKEAFVKALGLGLSYPLGSFTVSIGDAPAITSGGDGWTAHPVTAPDGYRAALVARIA